MSCTISESSYKFAFGNNTIHISFGNYDGTDEPINVGMNNNKETLTEFKKKFSNKEHCHIQFVDKNGELYIASYDNVVEFKCEQHGYTFYTMLHYFEYDLCKDAMLQCIDFHLSK